MPIKKAQKLYFHKKLLHTRVKDRVNKIKSIKNWILKNEDLIYSSCVRDYKKPLTEFNNSCLSFGCPIIPTQFTKLEANTDFKVQ